MDNASLLAENQSLKERVLELERRLAEASRQQLAPLELRRLVDVDAAGITVSQPDGRIIQTNDYYLNLLGYTRQEFEAGLVDWKKCTAPEYLPLDEIALAQLAEQGVSAPFEKEYIRRDGTRVWAQVRFANLGEGRYVGFIQDISPRKTAEQALQAAHELATWMARFPDENPEPVARISTQGVVLYCNPAAAEKPGWGLQTGQRLCGPLLELVELAQARGVYVQQDLPLGEGFYTLSVMPFPGENYANLYGHDITLRQQAELALAAHRRRTRDILASIGDALIALDRDWNIIYANEQGAEFSGWTASELIGKNLWEVWPKLLGTPTETNYRRVMADRTPLNFRMQGLYSPGVFDVSVYPSSEGISVYFTDRTEQVRAEQSLRRSETLHRTIVRNIPDSAMWVVDRELRYLVAEGTAITRLGLAREMMEGRMVEQSLSDPNRLQSAQRFRRALAGETQSYEAEYHGMVWWSQYVPLQDEQGQVFAAMRLLLDITERKQAEKLLKDYALQLERSNRSLQEFAYLASHDLQEPLRKVESFGSILLGLSSNLEPQQVEYIQRMQQAAARMRRMVTDLLALSRVERSSQPFVLVELDQVLRDVLSLLELQVQRTAGQVAVGPLPKIEADPSQLQQLFQNLIGNALKFHRPGQPPQVKVYAGNCSVQLVEIVVEDQGIGFDQADAERIFQPFQRLVGLSEFEGSGMGLAICKKIVDRHHGSLNVRSQVGQGSVFTVSLPTSDHTH